MKMSDEEKKAKKKADNAAWRASHKEELKAYLSKWKKANPDRVKANAASWRNDNRAVARAATNRWYHANPESSKARAVKWAKRNPERTREIGAKSAKANPDKIRAKSSRRRALKARVLIGSSRIIERWEKTWRKKRVVRCYWCSAPFNPKACHSDHVIPLAKGGAHSIENLCISCASCNVKKHASTLDDWNAKIGEPVLF